MQSSVSETIRTVRPGGRRGFFPPLMGKLLADRKTAAALGCAAILLVCLQMAGLPGWLCPVDSILGQPCPGCGLTRSLVQLASGQWAEAVHTHPMAPLAATALILMSLTAVLPVRWRRGVTARVVRLECRSGIGIFTIIAMFSHWFGRLGGYW